MEGKKHFLTCEQNQTNFNCIFNNLGERFSLLSENDKNTFKKSLEAYIKTKSIPNNELFYEELSANINIFFNTEELNQTKNNDLNTFLAIAFQGNSAILDILAETNADISKIQSLIAQKIAEIKQSSVAFDAVNFVKNIFSNTPQITKEELENSLNEDIPTMTKTALLTFLSQFKGKMINKKMVQNIVNKSIQNNDQVNPQAQAEISLLKNSRIFFDSIKYNPHLIDLCVADFVKEQISFTEVIEMLGINENSLIYAYIKAKYDNNYELLETNFVKQMEKRVASENLINELTPESLQGVLKILVDLSLKEIKINDIYLRTGLGGNPEEIPVRIFSYILPALNIAQRFFEKYGEAPQVELFTGQEAAIACNLMDADKVRANTDYIFNSAQQFVERFYPNLQNSFKVVFDQPWKENLPLTNVIEYLEDILKKQTSGDPKLTKIVDELLRRGESHGNEHGKEHALKYAAFHAICFEDISTINHYLNKDIKPDKKNISIGAHAEKEFAYMRKILKNNFAIDDFNNFLEQKGFPVLTLAKELKENVNYINISTNTGAIPPYYQADSYDISFKDVKEAILEEIDIFSMVGEKIRCSLSEWSRQSDFVQALGIIYSSIPPQIFLNFLINFYVQK